MQPLTREQKVQRLQKRKRKKTWAARVWMRRHVHKTQQSNGPHHRKES